jgi:hypothetical protein
VGGYSRGNDSLYYGLVVATAQVVGSYSKSCEKNRVNSIDQYIDY